MTNETGLTAGGDARENGERDPRASDGGGRRLRRLLIVAGAGLVVLVAIVYGVRHIGILGGVDEVAREAVEPQPAAHFLDLDEMVVTLDADGRARFLKVKITLELENVGDEARIKAVMPRIVDYLQVFLRELRVEELQGSHSLYRVRGELLRRVNAAAHPARAKDVLFKELVIQ